VIVLDTNVVSELIKPAPAPPVITWVDEREPAELVITAITAAELRAGVAILPRGHRSNQVGQRMDALLTFTFAGSVLPFDIDTAGHYAEVVAARRRAGKPIAALDAQIAGLCRRHRATLATRNIRDFDATGVELVDPWTA
jgi:toxin FitB